jgi:3-hydroxyacyl-CoA dehydrogenase/enoyl-CoA hydratase/3-hydroxybutyryl-CoA epimerase/3-hydroxyacyl-CoA dehydrogenase/enoyl-CoA hydratase/3-hydroxybutyryl-CoA epimerase/enoyl-CoA isomerase
MAAAISLSMPESDVALLTIDLPDKGANVLSQAVLGELAGHLDALEKRTELAGLIVASAKPGIFVAGADLREFAAALAGDLKPEWTVSLCRQGQDLFRRLSQCPFVTVAAIDGLCLGGGAELAIWCDRRLMTDNPKAQFGFPEVKLGIMPGWGGTARAPRIIGLSKAVELIAGGESIDGQTARSLGMATDLVKSDRLLPAALALVRTEQHSGDFRRDRERWSQPLEMTDTELYFLGATANAYIQQETKGHYPAPLAALEVMLEAAKADIDAACQMEAEGMAKLFGSPVNKALLNVFFLSDRNKKDTGVERSDVKPRPVKSLGIFGAGIMGSSIAAAALKRSVPITITDVNAGALAKGVAELLEEVSYNKATKGPDPKRTLQFAPLVKSTASDAEIAACDLVLEAVVENVEVKKQLYARVETLLRADALLASNTSTIPIATLSADLKRPERFCGIHFFNPVRKMPLVEVIRGPKTSDETVVSAVAFAKSIGKSPIVLNDGPGFLVNRCLLPYMNEALELLLDGASIDAVERAAKQFGMPMGPLTLYDVVGIDTAFYAGMVMYQAFPDRCVANPLILQMVKQKRLGQKTGSGFFKYKDAKARGEPDPDFDKLLQSLLRKPRKLSGEEITHRLFLPMLLEATRIVEDKIVRDPRDVDLGLIYGIGFPPFKGGLLFWADTVGAKQIIQWLKPLEPLGERMKPTATLREMAERGGKFYGR